MSDPGSDARSSSSRTTRSSRPLIVDLLGTLGEVHWPTSGEAGVEARLAPRDWDLIVTDIELPGIDGIELLGDAQAQPSGRRDAVLSGHSSFDYAVAALRAGADDYLTKPFDPPALRREGGAS